MNIIAAVWRALVTFVLSILYGLFFFFSPRLSSLILMLLLANSQRR